MKKNYKTPAVCIMNVETVQMIAESLNVNRTGGVSSESDLLTRRRNVWDDDDEEE